MPSSDFAAVLLNYLQSLPGGAALSAQVQAEMAYLYFRGAECPLLYHADEDARYVWEEHWQPVGSSLARVNVYFQTKLEHSLRAAIAKAKAMNIASKLLD